MIDQSINHVHMCLVPHHTGLPLLDRFFLRSQSSVKNIDTINTTPTAKEKSAGMRENDNETHLKRVERSKDAAPPTDYLYKETPHNSSR